jgi:hypothetical protein
MIIAALVAAMVATVVWAIIRRRFADESRPLVAGAPTAGGGAGESALPGSSENVQFTVYRPRAVEPSRWFPLLAFAHLTERRPDAADDEPDPIEEVERQARSVLAERADEYQELHQDASQPIPRDGELTLVPEMEGVAFNPPRHTFRWVEPVHRAEFRMRAADTLAGTTVRGRLSVYLGCVLIAEVTLVVRVETAGDDAEPAPLESAQARPYRRIFASYSRKDMAIVRQLGEYARSLGDEFMRDLTHLRSGEDWDARLGQMIDEAEIFQLFWSSNAMASAAVRKECEHALALDRPHFIRPVYWEDPFPQRPEDDLPPAALRRLHFHRLGSSPPPAHAAPPAPAIPEPSRPGAESVPPDRLRLEKRAVSSSRGCASSLMVVLVAAFLILLVCA